MDWHESVRVLLDNTKPSSPARLALIDLMRIRDHELEQARDRAAELDASVKRWKESGIGLSAEAAGFERQANNLRTELEQLKTQDEQRRSDYGDGNWYEVVEERDDLRQAIEQLQAQVAEREKDIAGLERFRALRLRHNDEMERKQKRIIWLEKNNAYLDKKVQELLNRAVTAEHDSLAIAAEREACADAIHGITPRIADTKKSRPMIFDAESVRGILAGTKTMTRRVMKPQPAIESHGLLSHPKLCGHFAEHVFGGCLLKLAKVGHAVGDRLYVKETFRYGWYEEEHFYNDMEGRSCSTTQMVRCDDPEEDSVWYAADGEPGDCPHDEWGARVSPLYMPRWASRITLEITEVRVERVQDIREDGAVAEGCTRYIQKTARLDFSERWDAINQKRGYPWSDNPWVWVYEFRRVEAKAAA